jgi:TATA-box binding protein (TBP) (component of TFIID and TFIIIB)
MILKKARKPIKKEKMIKKKKTNMPSSGKPLVKISNLVSSRTLATETNLQNF